MNGQRVAEKSEKSSWCSVSRELQDDESIPHRRKLLVRRMIGRSTGRGHRGWQGGQEFERSKIGGPKGASRERSVHLSRCAKASLHSCSRQGIVGDDSWLEIARSVQKVYKTNLPVVKIDPLFDQLSLGADEADPVRLGPQSLVHLVAGESAQSLRSGGRRRGICRLEGGIDGALRGCLDPVVLDFAKSPGAERFGDLLRRRVDSPCFTQELDRRDAILE